MNKMNQKKNTNRINTYELGNQLHKHLAERARLQREHDDLWTVIHRYGCNRSAQMDKIDSKIGKNTYAIDRIIGQLVKVGCRSGKAHSMAVSYLKSEIARNQRIAAKWTKSIGEVERREHPFRRSTGEIHYDTTNARNYLAKVKRKIASAQSWLSNVNRRHI